MHYITRTLSILLIYYFVPQQKKNDKFEGQMSSWSEREGKQLNGTLALPFTLFRYLSSVFHRYISLKYESHTIMVRIGVKPRKILIFLKNGKNIKIVEMV